MCSEHLFILFRVQQGKERQRQLEAVPKTHFYCPRRKRKTALESAAPDDQMGSGYFSGS
jgi:hypothetical protein